jgi:hypothetical protein
MKTHPDWVIWLVALFVVLMLADITYRNDHTPGTGPSVLLPDLSF